MAGFHTGENLTVASSENFLLLSVGERLEFGTCEAALCDILAGLNDVELLGNRDSGLLGIARNHDYVDASRLAVLDSLSALRAHGVLDANEAEEGAVALEFGVVACVLQQVLSVLLSHLLHVASIGGNRYSEHTVALSGSFVNALVKLLLVSFGKGLCGVGLVGEGAAV